MVQEDEEICIPPMVKTETVNATLVAVVFHGGFDSCASLVHFLLILGFDMLQAIPAIRNLPRVVRKSFFKSRLPLECQYREHRDTLCPAGVGPMIVLYLKEVVVRREAAGAAGWPLKHLCGYAQRNREAIGDTTARPAPDTEV